MCLILISDCRQRWCGESLDLFRIWYEVYHKPNIKFTMSKSFIESQNILKNTRHSIWLKINMHVLYYYLIILHSDLCMKYDIVTNLKFTYVHCYIQYKSEMIENCFYFRFMVVWECFTDPVFLKILSYEKNLLHAASFWMWISFGTS